MSQLISLVHERQRKTAKDNEALVSSLKELLASAERGELKGLCFASVRHDDMLSFGVLPTEACGVHELVGASQLLNFRLVAACTA
jgi:hypothetical protein